MSEIPSYRKTFKSLVTIKEMLQAPDLKGFEVEDGLIVRKCVMQEQIKTSKQQNEE